MGKFKINETQKKQLGIVYAVSFILFYIQFDSYLRAMFVAVFITILNYFVMVWNNKSK